MVTPVIRLSPESHELNQRTTNSDTHNSGNVQFEKYGLLPIGRSRFGWKSLQMPSDSQTLPAERFSVQIPPLYHLRAGSCRPICKWSLCLPFLYCCLHPDDDLPATFDVLCVIRWCKYDFKILRLCWAAPNERETEQRASTNTAGVSQLHPTISP